MAIIIRETLVSAARRHLRDATHFAMDPLQPSPDQAWHLAGFAPECIRKACFRSSEFDKALSHDWTESSESLLDLAISLDPHAWRYRLYAWAQEHPILSKWRPDHRYDRTGSHGDPQLQQLLAASKELVCRVCIDLWADGVLVKEDI